MVTSLHNHCRCHAAATTVVYFALVAALAVVVQILVGGAL